jgi:hypothetical protein
VPAEGGERMRPEERAAEIVVGSGTMAGWFSRRRGDAPSPWSGIVSPTVASAP